MARTVLLTTVRRQARELASMEVSSEPTTDSFVDTTELDGMINTSFGIWYGMVSRACPERFETTQSITANGSAQYAFPSAYGYTLGVEYVPSSGTEVQDLPRVPFTERNRYSSQLLSTNGQALGYRLNATGVVLIPSPSSGSYRHVYIPSAPVLGDGTGGTVTSFDGVNGWERWLVLDVAIQMLLKEESFEAADRLSVQREKVELEIKAAAQDRELMNPRRVVDTRASQRWGNRCPDSDFWW